MSWLTTALTSTIGRKVTMAATGLFLVSFLFVHLGGNFALFNNDGGEAFNKYTKFMTTNPVIRVMEIVLVLGFVIHIYQAVVLTKINKSARAVDYAVKHENKEVSWFSKNMGLSGSIVLAFLILHLINFYGAYKFGTPAMQTYDGEEYKDMFIIVKQTFQEQMWVSVFYMLAMILLGMHLAHGFQSAFKTFGVEHKKYTPTIKLIGNVIAVLVPLGFASMPAYFMVLAFMGK